MINNWYYMSVLVDELWNGKQKLWRYRIWLRSDHCGDLMTDSSIAEYMYSQLPRIVRRSLRVGCGLARVSFTIACTKGALEVSISP